MMRSDSQGIIIHSYLEGIIIHSYLQDILTMHGFMQKHHIHGIMVKGGGGGNGGRVWGNADVSCCGLLYLTYASSICIFFPVLFVGSSAHIVYFCQKCTRNILLFPALLTFVDGTVLHETNVVYVNVPVMHNLKHGIKGYMVEFHTHSAF